MQNFLERVKRRPRDFKELLQKRVEDLHPGEPQERIAAILEKVRTLDAEISGRKR